MNRFDRRGLDRRHAFSIAEIVISMAIIILLSILGFTACYVALGSQRNASRNLEILSAMDGASSAFEAACEAYAPSGEAGEKLNFLNEFHRRLAFALDSYAPNVRGLDEAAGYGVGQDWQISLANRTRTEYVVVEENGVERLEERVVVLEGLDLVYNGAQPSGRYVFVYTYYNEQIELRATLNIVAESSYTLYLNGYRAGSSLSAFEWEVTS